MTKLDRLMNSTVVMATSPNCFKRKVLPRIAVIGIIALEMLHVAYHTIKLPFQVFLLTLRIPPWLASRCIDSPSLDAYQKSLSGPYDIVKTIIKIIALVIGIFCSLTIGLYSPAKNFKAHVALGLIVDDKAEALKVKKAQEKAIEREKEKELLRVEVRAILAKKRALKDKISQYGLGIIPSPLVPKAPKNNGVTTCLANNLPF